MDFGWQFGGFQFEMDFEGEKLESNMDFGEGKIASVLVIVFIIKGHPPARLVTTYCLEPRWNKMGPQRDILGSPLFILHQFSGFAHNTYYARPLLGKFEVQESTLPIKQEGVPKLKR
jgi:hypothetical protein